MSAVMDVTPKTDKIDTGVKDPKAIAKALGEALADTYRLLFKSHAYHWNVEGPLFYSLHTLTEAQYQDLFAAADELAERIRALGQLAPATFDELTKMSTIKDLKSMPSAQEMIEDLASDHEMLAKKMHAVAELAEKHKDIVTADMVTARSGTHEKAAWMLRATAS